MLFLESYSKFCESHAFCHFYHMTFVETKQALPYYSLPCVLVRFGRLHSHAPCLDPSTRALPSPPATHRPPLSFPPLPLSTFFMSKIPTPTHRNPLPQSPKQPQSQFYLISTKGICLRAPLMFSFSYCSPFTASYYTSFGFMTS